MASIAKSEIGFTLGKVETVDKAKFVAKVGRESKYASVVEKLVALKVGEFIASDEKSDKEREKLNAIARMASGKMGENRISVRRLTDKRFAFVCVKKSVKS